MSLPTFVELCRGIGLVLEPGQLVTCRVAFDGVDPVDLEGEERELARRIFGDVERFTPEQRRIFGAVCGGRAGKSRLFSATRLLHLGLTVDLSRLAPEEPGYGMIVGPKMTHAKQVLAYVRGAIRSVPALAASVVRDAAEEIVIRRGGYLVSFLCAAASVRGDTQRGKTLFGFTLEEACFFRDAETGAVNDVDLFQAMMPRLLPDGQAIVPSTPYVKAGFLFDLWARNFGHPVDAIVAHAPTTLLRSDPHILEQVALVYAQDPANARRELGAEFVSLDASRFFDDESVERAAAPTNEIADADRVIPGDRITAGGDFGFVKNTSALVVGFWRGDVYHVLRIVERLPGDGAPLVPSETVRAFGSEARALGAGAIMVDAHYREAVREHLLDAATHLYPAPEGQKGKADTYAKLRMLLREGKVRLPDNPRLVRQLREVEARLLAGGGISLSSPTWTDGAHGDIVAALVLAVWQEHGATVAAPPTWQSADHKREAEIEEALVRQENGRKRISAWGRRLLLQ